MVISGFDSKVLFFYSANQFEQNRIDFNLKDINLIVYNTLSFNRFKSIN